MLPFTILERTGALKVFRCSVDFLAQQDASGRRRIRRKEELRKIKTIGNKKETLNLELCTSGETRKLSELNWMISLPEYEYPSNLAGSSTHGKWPCASGRGKLP